MHPAATPRPAAPEPIAVVSVGCRLPGGIRDLAGLSEVLSSGDTVLGPVPADRWSESFCDPSMQRVGTTRSHVGSFLPDIARFDAEFFGISPREAREMDPQQRLVLEVAWEAMEANHAGREHWAGGRTGVFVGVLASDYLLLHSKTRGTDKIDPFYATGKEFSFGAGRIAYTFDLHGPVMTVTTACSSSLLSVHLACQSLRAGECDAALAGGVSLLIVPELTVFMSRVGAVSPTGRSLPFSAEADGVVRGEGCGLVLLKRLSDAQRDGDEVLAVINGSAVNHDGRSAGLTVPSTQAQAELIRQALTSSGLDSGQIDYVEAHATGTPLGDPIELAALAEVFGSDQRREKLLVGSHKAVFGHLDSAAGILGLLKAVGVVAGGLVPAQPALGELNPAFDWADSGLQVATEPHQLGAGERPRRAGVSAFGLSGTNVHVILSQPPVSSSEQSERPVLLAFGSGLPQQVEELVARHGSDPTFAHILQRCAQALSTEVTWSLGVLLREPKSLAGRPDVAEPAAFAVQLACAHYLRERGLAPAAVAGAGCGEIAAAVFAGSLDLQTGALLALRRGAALLRGAGSAELDAAELDGDLAELLAGGEAHPVLPVLAPAAATSSDQAEVTDPQYWHRNFQQADQPSDSPGAAFAQYAARYQVIELDAITELDEVLGDRTSGPASRPQTPLRSWGGESYWLAGVQPGTQGQSDSNPVDPAPAAAAVPAVGTALPVELPAVETEPAVETGPPVDVADVRDRVVRAVQQVLGMAAAQAVPAQRPLIEQGFTSITVVELAVLLAAEFGTPEDPTLVYLCPRVDDLVEHFAAVPAEAAAARESVAETVTAPESANAAEPADLPESAAPESADLPEPAAAAEPATSAESEALAIVGMACRVPGASTLDEFWALLSEARCQVGELPEHRRRRDGWQDLPAGVPTRGGYLDNIEAFDAGFFKISPMEAARIDPQQRLFLEVAAEALADAGLAVNSMLAARTGVYVGMNTTDYQQRLTRDQSEVDVYYGTGNCFAGTPGRLAFALNLGGPCLAVDTACSSSLTAIHLARQALRSGDCDAAVVGGVNVISGPTVSVSMSRAGALAADGRCKTFAGAADGYGRGEGAGVIVIKRLAQARQDGDRIYATVLGSAINSDGASGGFTVPNAAAQTAVVQAALASAGVAPSEVGYLEAHGTGTPLGDPIELQALKRALRPAAGEGPYVGSVKSLIGHLEAAAGITGVIKAALAVQHDRIPPHALGGTPTSKLDWPSLGLRLADGAVDWPRRASRVAGISAFGFTGSNAHVVLGQAPDRTVDAAVPAAPQRPGGTALLVSADSPAALRARAGQLGELISRGADLDDLSYMLARRSSSYRCRAVVLADTAEQAADALGALAADRPHTGLVQGSRAVSEPSGVHLHFGWGDYLGADWAYLPDEFRMAATTAAAEVDRLSRSHRQTLSTTQRQQLISLRAQVGWSAVWRAVGLQLATASGDGIGAHAAAWLRGEIELDEAVRRALQASWDIEAVPAEVEQDGEGAVLIDGVPRAVNSIDAWGHVLAQAQVAGYPVDWDGLVPSAGTFLPLPRYPWQHRDYWYTSTSAAAVAPAAPAAADPQQAGAGRSATRPAEPPADEPAASRPAEQLLFSHDWVSTELGTPAGTGNWLVIADPAEPLADELTAALAAAGAQASTVPIPQAGPSGWIDTLTEVGATLAGVVLLAVDRPDAAILTMQFGQAVQRFPGAVRGAHLITRLAHPATDAADPEQAAAWAVGSVLAVELGQRWGRLIDLDAASAPAGGSGPAVAAALLSEQAGDQLRSSAAAWQGRRIRHASQREGAPAPTLNGEHTVAVHGPDAATVQPVLRWLSGHGDPRVLLHLGTAASTETSAREVEQVAEASQWLARVGELAGAGLLAGACYCANELAEPVTVRDSTPAQQAEAGGADELLGQLAELLACQPPELLLLVVDAAADWGAVGAAATGARASRNRALLQAHPAIRDRARVLGLLPFDHPEADAVSSVLQAESGIGLLNAAQLDSALAAVLAGPIGAELSAGMIDLDRYVALCQRLAPRALLSELESAGTPAESETALRRELAGLSGQRRADRVLNLVLATAGSVLGLTAREVDPDGGFFDLGMDSITALSLKTQLENETCTELPATLTFELPTPRKLARHLLGLLETAPAAAAPERAASPQGTAPTGAAPAAGSEAGPPARAGNQPVAGTADDPAEATDEELLRLLSQATASARNLLQEASQW